MTRRQWLERGVIVIAAVASIATSRKGWRLEAKLVADDPAKARLITVEASQEPSVEIDQHSVGVLRPHDGGTVWPGTARYLVPTGARVQYVSIGAKCSGGLCSGECKVPSGQYVSVTSSTPVETWKLAIKHEPQTVTLEPGKYTTHRISVEATHRAQLEVDTNGLTPDVGAWGDAFNVSWPVVQAPTQVTWTPRLEIEGLCATPGPCTPPPDAKVTITNITVERY